ncbi:hypothetical protein [Enhygromyxa salina]|nr:hypothetical protein [Enhygromyxa salina]
MAAKVTVVEDRASIAELSSRLVRARSRAELRKFTDPWQPISRTG